MNHLIKNLTFYQKKILLQIIINMKFALVKYMSRV